MKPMHWTQPVQRGKPEVFARALPESLEAIETYAYEKNISKSPYLRSSGEPTGKIEICVPFDGYRTFPRHARDDIEHQIGSGRSTAGLQARIGHLALTDFGRTDLKSILNLSDRCGTVPLAIPLSGSGLESLDQLGDDRHACIVSFGYAPSSPEVVPVNVNLSLWDEESLSTLDGDLLVGSSSQGSENLTVKVKTQENFLRSLLLQMTIKVSLPKGVFPEESTPTITRMSLRWPTITSLRGLHLFIGASKLEVPIRYDPMTQCLEWFHVPLTKEAKSEATSFQVFSSQPMQLLIDYPGELYKQDNLGGVMDVEIPGQLLSGLKMVLFDCRGTRVTAVKPKLTTKLRVEYKVVLSDSFARRILSPYQHLCFQEVVLDEMRIMDLKNALVDRGFRILQEASFQGGRESQHILLAERPEAPDPLRLTILVAGIHREAERQAQVDNGQIKIRVERGDLSIYMRGELRGKSQRLIHEMNAFQATLRGLFPNVIEKY